MLNWHLGIWGHHVFIDQISSRSFWAWKVESRKLTPPNRRVASPSFWVPQHWRMASVWVNGSLNVRMNLERSFGGSRFFRIPETKRAKFLSAKPEEAEKAAAGQPPGICFFGASNGYTGRYSKPLLGFSPKPLLQESRMKCVQSLLHWRLLGFGRTSFLPETCQLRINAL